MQFNKKWRTLTRTEGSTSAEIGQTERAEHTPSPRKRLRVTSSIIRMPQFSVPVSIHHNKTLRFSFDICSFSTFTSIKIFFNFVCSRDLSSNGNHRFRCLRDENKKRVQKECPSKTKMAVRTTKLSGGRFHQKGKSRSRSSSPASF